MACVRRQRYHSCRTFWLDQSEARGGHPGQPNPGKRGILAVHAQDADTPGFILRKVTVPPGSAALRVVVSGDPYEIPGKSDFLLQAGVLADGQLDWFGQETIFKVAVRPNPTNARAG